MGRLQLHGIGKASAGFSVWGRGRVEWSTRQAAAAVVDPDCRPSLFWRRFSRRAPARLGVFFEIYGQWRLQAVLPFQSTTWGCATCFMSRVWERVRGCPVCYFSYLVCCPFPSSSLCLRLLLACFFLSSLSSIFLYSFAGEQIKKILGFLPTRLNYPRILGI